MGNLYWHTIAELRAECRKRGLSDYGNKKDLVARLTNKGLVEEPEALFEKFESYFDRKYADLIALAEKAEKDEIKILPYLPKSIENIPEYTLTPKQLDKYLSTVKKIGCSI